MLRGYEPGGTSQPASGLANVLRYYGTTAPHTREPWSEAMLFGIAGGIGVSYWTWEFKGRPPQATIFFRNLDERAGHPWARVATRLATTVAVHETGSGRKAADRLRACLDSGRPPLASLDVTALPYRVMPPELVSWTACEAVICGHDDDLGLWSIDDLAPAPWWVAGDALAAARAATKSARHRLVTIERPQRYAGLLDAVTSGLRDCVSSMLEPPLRNLGLPGLEKWANLLVDHTDPKSWATVFPPGVPLFDALVAAYNGVAGEGTGGDALRGLYAEFLQEAGAALDAPDLLEAAAHARLSARLWRQFAESVLPDASPPLRRVRSLLRRNRQLFEGEGESVLPGMANNARELTRVREDIAQFPMNNSEVDDLLRDLSEQLLAIHTVEQEAMASLQRWLGA